MDLARAEGLVDYMELGKEKRIVHPSGAEIFIADAYRNYDPEFPEPHYQTWFHVSFGENKPYAGRKLFFDFGKGVTKEERLKAAEVAAGMLIDAVLTDSGHATG